jgi:hypothetical protein
MLTPAQMIEMKEVSGLTYLRLQKAAGVSRAQMCEYARGVGKLRPEQLAAIEKALRKSMHAHSAKIEKLVAGEKAA